MKNLYKVTTSYDGEINFAHYYVAASNGTEAMAFVNVLTFRKRAKVQHERANEVEEIAPIEYDSLSDKKGE